MSRNAKLIEKYYEQIKANIELDLSPAEFAKKCVADYDMIEYQKLQKKREEAQEKARLREIARKKAVEEKLERELEREEKRTKLYREKKGEFLKKNIGKTSRANQIKLNELGHYANKEYKQHTEESILNSMKTLSKMIDIMRGDDD
jgi:hypothetical protein